MLPELTRGSINNFDYLFTNSSIDSNFSGRLVPELRIVIVYNTIIYNAERLRSITENSGNFVSVKIER